MTTVNRVYNFSSGPAVLPLPVLEEIQRDMMALPKVGIAMADPPPSRLAGLFEREVREVWLEIGFGGGEHLLWQAQHNADIGLIGCEPFRDGAQVLANFFD